MARARVGALLLFCALCTLTSLWVGEDLLRFITTGNDVSLPPTEEEAAEPATWEGEGGGGGGDGGSAEYHGTGCGCCDWQTDLAQYWTKLRANKTILLLDSTGGGLGNQFQGWMAAAMVSIALDRAFVINHNMPGDGEPLSSFFQSQWWPFAPTPADRQAIEGQQILEYSTWYPWLQRERGLEAFQRHFPRDGPIVLRNDWPSLATVLGSSEIIEKVRRSMGGIDKQKIVPCLNNFLFTSLADRLQQKSKDLLTAIDHSGPGPHSKISVGVHIRLGDEALLNKYQQVGKHGSSVGDKRPFDPEKILRCMDKIINGVEGGPSSNQTEGKEVVFFLAADTTAVYGMFIERYGTMRVIITPGEPYHIARAVDDPQLLDIATARDKAYLDWFLLSKVDILIHNFKSSYSITAGQSSLQTRQITPDSCDRALPGILSILMKE